MIIKVFSVHQSQSVCVYLWFLCVSVVLSVLTDGGGGGAGSLPTHQWVKTTSPTVQVCVYNPDGAADTVISVCIVYTNTSQTRFPFTPGEGVCSLVTPVWTFSTDRKWNGGPINKRTPSCLSCLNNWWGRTGTFCHVLLWGHAVFSWTFCARQHFSHRQRFYQRSSTIVASSAYNERVALVLAVTLPQRHVLWHRFHCTEDTDVYIQSAFRAPPAGLGKAILFFL